jgi:hypothetical protein
MACDGVSLSPWASASKPANRLGSAAFGLRLWPAGIGSKPVSNSGPSPILDQCRVQPGVKLTLVRNPTGVDRIREQFVYVSAREQFAAALSAIRCRAALCPQPEPVGLPL